MALARQDQRLAIRMPAGAIASKSHKFKIQCCLLREVFFRKKEPFRELIIVLRVRNGSSTARYKNPDRMRCVGLGMQLFAIKSD